MLTNTLKILQINKDLIDKQRQCVNSFTRSINHSHWMFKNVWL